MLMALRKFTHIKYNQKRYKKKDAGQNENNNLSLRNIRLVYCCLVLVLTFFLTKEEEVTQAKPLRQLQLGAPCVFLDTFFLASLGQVFVFTSICFVGAK